MASRFTWTQIVKWEEQALRTKVPENIPGLIPRSIASNYQFYRRAMSYERNGEMNVLNQLLVIRLGFGFFVFGCVYQMWRVLLAGWTELHEHHNYNFDNMVYPKLSTRNAPYHSPTGMP